MRKLLLKTMLLLCALIVGSGTSWATDVTYKLTIDASDFNTTSYAANNNEKTSNAVCTTDNTKTYEVKWTSNQVMKQSNNMQWQKSKGYIYNSTDLGTITAVTVTSSAGSFTTYYGSSAQPSSGTTVGGGYFQTKVGGATGTTSKLEVTFTISEGSTPATTHSLTYSANPPAGGSLTVGSYSGSPATVAEGATVNISATPNTGYVFNNWTVAGTGSSVANASSASTTFTMGTADATLTANFTAVQTYSVTYHANVTGTADIVENYNEGEDVTVAANTFANSGYVFKNWNTSADGTGNEYAPDDEIQNISANIDLYAQWDEITYDFAAIDFNSWLTSYSAHTVTYSDATVTFASASKQNSGQTIDDQPVTKGGEVELKLTDGSTMSKVTFYCTQWGTKDQTITLHYSTNGGSSYSDFDPAVTSTNFTISKDNLPTGTNAVKITFSSNQNQVGIRGASIVKVVSTDPTITASNVEIAYNTTNGSIAFEVNNPVNGGAISASTQDSWITLGNETASPISFTCTANEANTERTATVTLTYTYGDNETVTKDVTVTQAAPVVDYATLPFSYDNNALTANLVDGLTSSGITGKYDSSPKIKFDTTDDYVILKLNEVPGILSFDIKGQGTGTWSGTFDVLTSANGVDYNNTLQHYTSLSPSVSREVFTLDSSVRYIKWLFTSKTSGYNVALGNIVVEKPTVTLNASGYATYTSNSAIDYSDDNEFSAWTITGAAGETITFSKVTGAVPAGTGVLLMGTPSQVVSPVATTSGTAPESNLLEGITIATAVTTDQYYGLSGQTFVKVNAGTVKAGKALLPVSALGVSSSIRTFTFVFENPTTGISEVQNVSAEEFGEIFNLAGQRMNQPRKGVNIINGKKVLVK